MHTAISAFASSHFYRGLVRDASSVGGAPQLLSSLSSSVAAAGVAAGGDLCLRPILLVDVPHGIEGRGSDGSGADGTSYGNDEEAVIVAALVRHILTLLAAETARAAQSGTGAGGGTSSAPGSAAGRAAGSSPHRGIIGVITPYREQVRRIRAALRTALGGAGVGAGAGGASSSSLAALASQVVVSSVDAFQGQEMDHIIISCVRSRPPPPPSGGHGGGGSAAAAAGGGRALGFLHDARRLNVAITRARHSVALVCNAAHLSRWDADWRALIEHARRYARERPDVAAVTVLGRGGAGGGWRSLEGEGTGCAGLLAGLRGGAR
jgi:hypothetical protein